MRLIKIIPQNEHLFESIVFINKNELVDILESQIKNFKCSNTSTIEEILLEQKDDTVILRSMKKMAEDELLRKYGINYTQITDSKVLILAVQNEVIILDVIYLIRQAIKYPSIKEFKPSSENLELEDLEKEIFKYTLDGTFYERDKVDLEYYVNLLSSNPSLIDSDPLFKKMANILYKNQPVDLSRDVEKIAEDFVKTRFLVGDYVTKLPDLKKIISFDMLFNAYQDFENKYNLTEHAEYTEGKYLIKDDSIELALLFDVLIQDLFESYVNHLDL